MRSLGTLVKQLKAKTSLHDDFQSTLESFVDNRNILIHRAPSQPWWHDAKNQGRFGSAFEFLKVLMDQTETVKLAFEAVVLDYMHEFMGEDTEVLEEALEPFKSNGYLDAIQTFSEFSRTAIKKKF